MTIEDDWNDEVDSTTRKHHATRLAHIRAPRHVGTTDESAGRCGRLQRQSLRENLDSGTTGRTSSGRFRDSNDDEGEAAELRRKAS